MRVANSYRAILFSAFLCSFTPLSWSGVNLPAQPGETVIPNQYLVKVAPGVNAQQVVQRVLPGAGYYPLTENLSLVVTASSSTVAAIASNPLVQYVEPNRLRNINLAAVNDPSYASQYALQIEQAIQAWQIVPGHYLSSASPETGRIKVAILDTGVDCTHPDFMNASGTSTDSAQGGQLSFALSQAFVPTTVSPAACPWQDDHGHGTHTAGIIAAATQNAVGISGLGYPVELIVYKVLAQDGSGDDGTIATAIQSAADAGARIISMSLGGPGYSQTLQSAIAYAWQHDVLVIAAAGNSSSSTPFFPASAGFATAISASDSNNNIASFSNYGYDIGVAAPGNAILSTVPTYPVYIGVENYAYMSGTSMAAPHVAAVGGLVETSNPNLPGAALLEQIEQTANSNVANGGWDQYYGYGVVNAYNAVSSAIRPSSLGSLNGQVDSTFGIPVGGAVVTVNGSTVTADPYGRFRVPNLPPGNYTVTASAAGYSNQTITATTVPGADTILPIVLGASYGEFSGMVTNGSSATVPGAVVQAISSNLVQATTFSDANGNYSLWVPNAGLYAIRASAFGRNTTSVSSQIVSAGHNTNVNITLPALGSISGTVQNGSQPVSNAQLIFALGNYSVGAVTDSNGNYSTIGIPAGTYAVTATASGLPATTVPNVAVGGGVTVLNVQMGTAAPAPVTISVNPTSATILTGQTALVTATVNPSTNSAVTWSLSPQIGSVSNGLYQAPATVAAATTVLVIATSVADPTKSASASITVNPPVAISLTPASVSLSQGYTQQFTATVTGSSNTNVTWSMSPQVGQLSTSGAYIAPSSVSSAQTVTITATSVADSTKSASATVSLQPPQLSPGASLRVIITPAFPSITTPHTQQFSATVNGATNNAVSWAINPKLGQIDATGLYTPPSSVTSTQIVTVTATAAVNTAVSSSTGVVVMPGSGVAVTLSPGNASLTGGQSQTFTPTVTGSSNTTVTWTISPSVGTLNNGVYTAPAVIASAQTVTITATSAADTTKSASATVSLTPVTISLGPSSVSLGTGQSQAFTPTVTGSGNTSVTWSVSPSGVGSFANGVYTAPSTISSAQSITITATSQADPTKSASATVNLVPAVAVSVTPSAISLTAGQSQTFSASVGGSTNTAVNWSISPAGVGTFANGSYTAPSTISAAQTITITATSQADPTKSASATVSLAPVVAVSISPLTVSLSANQSQGFNVSVTGSTNTNVTWSFSPSNVGSLTGGIYYAPASITAAQTVTVTATSQADPTKSATATITLAPSVSISIAPNAVSLSPGQSQQFSVAVIASANSNVNWSFSPSNVGSLSNGVYTAPSVVSAPQTVAITATSAADPTKSATATVNLVPVVGVTLSPSSVNLTAGQQQLFTPSVAGSTNTAVTWTVSPNNVGAFVNGTYTAPSTINSPQTITITATSQADPTKTASATVNLVPVVGMSINPPSVSLLAGQSQLFTVSLTGTTNSGVTWAVSPNNVGSFVNGTYTAPSTINSPQTITITATSQADPTKSASATVNLVPVVGMSINPPSVSLLAGQQQLFTPSVAGSTNTAVTWAVSPNNVGSFVNGTYTAPSTIDSPQTITITATSQADPTKSASATVNLVPVVGMSINPPSVSLLAGQSQLFTVSLTGTTNSGVTWTASPNNVGSFVNGTYTAPSTINSPQTITITATSQANSAKSASATVNLVPVVGISINPPGVSLTAGQQQSFTTSVSGSTNTAVTWTVSPNNVGSFVNGTYTAPSTLNSPQTITVTATSQADPTKSASATINLVPVVAVTMTPPAVTLSTSKSQILTVGVTGTTNTAVTWTISPVNVGVLLNGIYTAPSTISGTQIITITATSQADPTKSAISLITLTGRRAPGQ